MQPQFDTYVAIDWSGAGGQYDGIAVAICQAGSSAPRLIRPRGGVRWTRSEVAEWISDRLKGNQRLLIGLDFAFGFPFEEANVGYLGGRLNQVDSVFALWKWIDEASCADPDFGCRAFTNDPRFAPLFWKSGQRPETWRPRKRRTELACATATQTQPETVFKLIGSKQVGKASISGIRVLHHIRIRSEGAVSFWPFEKLSNSAIAEIYPTLFRKLATGSVKKLSARDLNTALPTFGSQKMPATRANLSDHETDALISAAGLRSIASNPKTWSFPELTSDRVKREGWIIGVW